MKQQFATHRPVFKWSREQSTSNQLLLNKMQKVKFMPEKEMYYQVYCEEYIEYYFQGDSLRN